MSENLEQFVTQSKNGYLPKEKNQLLASERTEQGVSTTPTVPTSSTTHGEPTKRSSPKQRKASMEEYQQAYLTTPKIVDRQTGVPTFIRTKS